MKKLNGFMKFAFAVSFLFTALGVNAQKQYAKYYTVTITPDTKWVNTRANTDYPTHTGIFDGVWGCYVNNAWGFYGVDGAKIFDYEWVSPNSGTPEFSNGVVPMFLKDEDYGSRSLYLLYKDGTVKKLDQKYRSAYNYCDGITMAQNTQGKYVFLDTDGNEIYKDVVNVWPQSEDLNSANAIRPLKDDRRAFYDDKTGKWGFLDNGGKIVISPIFKTVRNFSDELALICDDKDQVYFIDKSGKKAFEPQWDYFDSSFSAFSSLSDFNCGYCTLRDGQDTFYYDKTGNEVAVYRFGRPFEYGYSWANPKTAKEDDWLIQPMDKDFNFVEGAYQMKPSQYKGFSGGLMITDGKVITPDGKIQILGALSKIYTDHSVYYDILSFNSYGYAECVIHIDGKRYCGFINEKGEFVVIFGWEKREVKEINTIYPKPDVKPPFTSKDDFIEATIPIVVCDQTPLGPKYK